MHENSTEISQKKLITNQQLGESQDNAFVNKVDRDIFTIFGRGILL